ncbi:hypothetical protein ACTM9N_12105 [Lachnospiraceae bacterium HCP1S3_A8]
MKENSRCEVQKEKFCDGEAGQFLDAFTDGSAGYIHGAFPAPMTITRLPRR